MLAGGAIGACVAIHGIVTLVSSSGRTANADLPQRRRGALYSLYFGTSMVLIVLASLLNAIGWTVPAMLVLAASMASLTIAVLRPRPGSKAESEVG
jgi:hypothetical protein